MKKSFFEHISDAKDNGSDIRVVSTKKVKQFNGKHIVNSASDSDTSLQIIH